MSSDSQCLRWDAIGLSREKDANGFDAIEHRVRKTRNMMNKGITNVVRQNHLMQQCV